VIALDRQEKGQDERSAVAQVEAELGIPVAAIVRLNQLVEFLSEQPDQAQALERIRDYRERYGA
jgi:orotate phosphoribosyltransferase